MGNLRTVSPIELSRQLLAILASVEMPNVDYLLSPDAYMQIWLGNIRQTYKSPAKVREGLAAQTRNWPHKPFLNVQAWDDDEDSINVQFDIWDRPNGRVLHPNCSLNITLEQDKIRTITLYQNQQLIENQTAIFAD
jgi:hypothetical protein